MPRRNGSALTAPKMPAGLGSSRPREREQLVLAGFDPPQSEPEDDGGSLTEARTQTERLRGRLLAIELAIREGALIPRAEADRERFAAARTLRNRVLGIAPRVAALVVSAETVADAQRILDRELRRCLESIADDLAPREA